MIDTNETRDDATKHRTEPHHVHYDPETVIGPSESFTIAVADIADVDPLELEPLYETIDPDTIDDFVRSGGVPDVGGQISFTYEGYDVTIHASGLFEIEPAD